MLSAIARGLARHDDDSVPHIPFSLFLRVADEKIDAGPSKKTRPAERRRCPMRPGEIAEHSARGKTETSPPVDARLLGVTDDQGVPLPHRHQGQGSGDTAGRCATLSLTCTRDDEAASRPRLPEQVLPRRGDRVQVFQGRGHGAVSVEYRIPVESLKDEVRGPRQETDIGEKRQALRFHQREP